VGRKTQESIQRRLGRPLPDRRTIVVTRRAEYRVPGVEVAHSLEEALEKVRVEEEVFVIGGAEIFGQALPFASRIYLTRVHARPAGDTSFPSVDLSEWRVISAERRPKNEENDYEFTFEVLERVQSG